MVGGEVVLWALCLRYQLDRLQCPVLDKQTAGMKMASEKAKSELYPVPLTIEGSAVLHQMFRVRWAAWQAVAPEERKAVVNEAAIVLGEMEKDGQSALFSLLGHKGDLMFVHFRETFDEVNGAELRLANL